MFLLKLLMFSFMFFAKLNAIIFKLNTSILIFLISFCKVILCCRKYGTRAKVMHMCDQRCNLKTSINLYLTKQGHHKQINVLGHLSCNPRNIPRSVVITPFLRFSVRLGAYFTPHHDRFVSITFSSKDTWT